MAAQLSDITVQEKKATVKLTKHYAKSFYLASKTLPIEKKEAAYAVYAFCRFSDNLVDSPGSQPQQDLDDWRKQLQLAFEQNHSDHPILSAFVKTVIKYAIPKHLAFDLLDGMQMDLTKNRYQNFSELYDYCYKVAAVPGLMMTHVFGYHDPQSKKYAIDLGVAMQLTNILRDLGEDLQNGKIYLPLDELNQFNYSESDLLNKTHNDNFTELMTFQINRARQYYQDSEGGISSIHLDSRLSVVLCHVLYRHILREIERQQYQVFHRRAVVPSWKKAILYIKSHYLTSTKFSQRNGL